MKLNLYKIHPAIIIIIGLITLFRKINAGCNACNAATYVSCKSKNTYTICFDGKTESNQTAQCKGGTVCTDQPVICQPEGGTVTAACSTATAVCNQCTSTTPSMICLSIDSYALCDQNSKPMDVFQCPKGFICSIENYNTKKSICASACDTAPTCLNSVVTTTVPSIADYQKYCENKAKGYYAISCTRFVYCEVINTVTTATLFECPSGLYIDPTKLTCVSEKPSNCD